MQIRLAANDEERLEAYRLRYAVFTVEVGDHRYSVDSDCIYVDQFDHSDTLLLIAVDEAKVVGTIRVDERSRGPFIGDEMYEWKLLGARFGLSEQQVQRTSVLVARGAVLPAWRCRKLFQALLSAAHCLALSREHSLSVGAISAGNTVSARGLTAVGYESYGIRRNSEGWLGEYFFCNLDVSARSAIDHCESVVAEK